MSILFVIFIFAYYILSNVCIPKRS